MADREAERSRKRLSRSLGRAPSASRVLGRVHRVRQEKTRNVDLARLAWTMARHPKSPPPRVAPVRQYSRRAFVRIRYSGAKKAGQWRAHGAYLEREGAQQEGGKGIGFSATSDDVSVSKTADGWQTAGDDKMFKFVLSPEDGARLDLVDYTRKVMARIEQQVGQPLEWCAIDHHNTDNPHVHILVRADKKLFLSNQLINKDAREIAGDEATRALGYRTEKEIQAGRDREIEQRRFTGLDREIQKKLVAEPPQKEGEAAPGTWLVEIKNVDKNQRYADRVLREKKARRQHIARLKALEEIGVAEKVGHMTWRLDAGWDKALKELETLKNRSSMLLQHRELMSDPRALPVVTKLEPGQRLVGRVLGTGMNDATDSPYILIEGADGKAHFVSQTAKMVELRGEGKLKPGEMVSLESKVSKTTDRQFLIVESLGLEIPSRGFTSVKITDQILDADLKHREKAGLQLPDPEAARMTSGFAGHYQRALIERSKRRAIEIEKAAAERKAREEKWQKEREERAARRNKRRRNLEIDDEIE